MKFVVQRSRLLEALQKVEAIVEKKHTLQILSNVLLDLKNGKLFLSSTNLDTSIQMSIPVEALRDGKVLVSAKNLLDIIRQLPEALVETSLGENHWIKISCGKVKFSYLGSTTEQFPAIPDFSHSEFREIQSKKLVEMIDRTQFCVSTDLNQYHVNGVFWSNLPNAEVRMISTDGHRLSLVQRELFLNHASESIFETTGMIIPQKGVKELRSFLNTGPETVGVHFEKELICFKNSDGFLVLRLLNVNYPDYLPIIPKSPPHQVRVQRIAFQNSLKRMSIVANDRTRLVKLQVSGEQLILSGSDSNLGEAVEELDLVQKGQEISIGFNVDYLLEGLQTMTSEEVELQFTNPLSACILKEFKQNWYTHVIMPIRIMN